MLYDKNEFRQDDESIELNEQNEFSFLDDESTGQERFFHENEYNQNAYAGLADRDEFEPGEAEAMDEYRSWAPGRKSILQKAMRVLKVRAITIAAGTVIITSPAAEKTGLTYPGASDLLKPDGTPILPRTHQHVFSGWTEKGKTSCTQPGTEVLICTDCNRTVEVLEVPRSNHSEPVWIVINEGNCSEPAEKQLICPDCGQLMESVTLPATGHRPQTSPGYRRTCTQYGMTDGQSCADCGRVLEERAIIPATGHTEVTDRAVAATCTAAGLTEGSHCDVCGEVITAQQTIPMLAHRWTPEPNNPAQHYCTVCGTVGAHTENVVAARVEPTCTAPGTEAHIECSDCQYPISQPVEIPAPGHTEIIDRAVAATCTVAGKTEGSHCSVCNTVIVRQTTIDALGHTWETIIIDDVTGEADALQHQCAICRHQAAHIWNPAEVSPNGHVCSCGYSGAHIFSTDAPTDTDTCDICHETWAAINNW